MCAKVAIQLLLSLGIVSSYIDDEEVQTEDIHVYLGSDFKDVLRTTLFVDKSLLIKRLVDNTKHGAGLLILTPRRFGKSTNMNMVKRFFEMNVDFDGKLVEDVEKTTNYNLFKNNYLNIYKITDFFNKHFGKYPVIFIDYGPLCNFTSVEQMLGIFFRKIMFDTFLQHKYLLNDDHLWAHNETCSWVDKEKFKLFLDKELNQKLTEEDIQTGFSYLAKLLHKRFEKRVIVLIDNYDVFVDSPLFSQNKDVYHFISAINCDLLRCDSVERSLVTGVIRTSGPSIDRGKILPSNVVDSAEAHNVWPYYGLSGVELENLLLPIIRDDEEREKVMGKIVHTYSGYSAATFEVGEATSGGQILDSQICSVWSVIDYMEKELAVENFSSLV